MFLVTLYDSEYGDVLSVKPAHSLADAMACLIESLSQEESFTVEVGLQEGHPSVKVHSSDTTLASVDYVVPVASVTAHVLAVQISSACQALERGQQEPLVTLLQGDASRQVSGLPQLAADSSPVPAGALVGVKDNAEPELKARSVLLNVMVPTYYRDEDLAKGVEILVKAGSEAAEQALEREGMEDAGELAFLIEVHSISMV